MDSLDLRIATPADTRHQLDLLAGEDLPTAGVEEHLDGFIIAERDGRIVGCAALEHYGASALPRSVAVRASERGGGLGRRPTSRRP